MSVSPTSKTTMQSADPNSQRHSSPQPTQNLNQEELPRRSGCRIQHRDRRMPMPKAKSPAIHPIQSRPLCEASLGLDHPEPAPHPPVAFADRSWPLTTTLECSDLCEFGEAECRGLKRVFDHPSLEEPAKEIPSRVHFRFAIEISCRIAQTFDLIDTIVSGPEVIDRHVQPPGQINSQGRRLRLPSCVICTGLCGRCAARGANGRRPLARAI